ncbi:MAG: hypothetical protein ACP5US_10570, partial [Candidatus Kryptoniota bacterium]
MYRVMGIFRKECFITIFIIKFIILANSLHAEGFVTVQGQKIIDSTGSELHFKGMGLGGWLEPEGYMFGMSSFANSPSEIREKINQLIGKGNTDSVWNIFLHNFVTEDDIKALHSWGFNLVRVLRMWYLSEEAIRSGLICKDT